ncbi:hypothetical protein HAHE_35300 [Haloferula helveola]|uniref:PEP-CTERM protein-sorting domain-containing protein n=1 Tax=Haloferula helveola TaxID=490095 RepID=A0ABM7RI50_9BACT|nr:hypothetical protein HAHE_35300 [Haloferula helveola]
MPVTMRVGKWQGGRTALAFLPALVTGTMTATAAITYIDPADIPIPTSFGGIYLDLNTGTANGSTEGNSVGVNSYTISYSEPASGDWDVNFFFGGAAMVHNDSINIYRAGDGTDNFSAVHNLEAGTLVNGASTGTSQPLAAPTFGGSGAYPADPHMGASALQFVNGADGYIGFVLDEGSSPLYGWMLVQFHDDGTPGLIKEWAYSDSPIEIGQIPEPHPAALLTFAACTVLLRRYRRRGRHAQNP